MAFPSLSSPRSPVLAMASDPAASSPPPRVDINSCPPEIIFHFLELGLSSSFEESSEFLLSTSLVRRSWRLHAQVLLWRDITIVNLRQAWKLVESDAFKRYQTHFLELRWAEWPEWDQIPVEIAYEILAGIQGLRWLTLEGWGGARVNDTDSLGINALCTPNLRTLVNLDLQNVYLYQDGSQTSPLFPFSLDSLIIYGYKTNSPTAFTTFSVPCVSLRAMEYSFEWDANPEEHQDFLKLFRSVATQLTRFQADCDGLIPVSFVPELSSCVNLRSILFIAKASDVLQVFRSLSSQLEYFSCNPVTDLETSAEALEREWVAIREDHLVRLPTELVMRSLEFAELRDDSGSEAWMKLLDLLKRAGKRIVFLDDCSTDSEFVF